MAKSYNNYTVAGITTEERLGNQYQLIISQPSAFSFGQDSTIEQRVTLWSQRDKKVSASDVERTQSLLREELGDEEIIFTDPSEATDDPNHIVNWVEDNIGTQIGTITQDGTYFNLGKPREYADGDRLNRFLTLYDPNTATEAYDETKHRVRVFNALPDYLQEQYEAQEGDNTYKSRQGNISLYHMANIRDVLFDDGVNFQDRQDDAIEKMTRAELKEAVLEELAGFKNMDPLVDKIEALPEDYPFGLLIEILGGRTAENVSELAGRAVKEKRLARNIETLIKGIDRRAVSFYMKNPDTGFVFRSSRLNIPRDNNAYNYTLSFEYITDDFVVKDLLYFFNLLASKAENFGISQENILEDLEEAGFYDGSEFTFTDETSSLEALRALFIGRNVNVRTGIGNQSGKVTKENLGAGIQEFLEKVGDVETVPTKADESVDEIEEEEDFEEDLSEIEDNPFDFDDDEDEDIEDEEDNPFA